MDDGQMNKVWVDGTQWIDDSECMVNMDGWINDGWVGRHEWIVNGEWMNGEWMKIVGGWIDGWVMDGG